LIDCQVAGHFGEVSVGPPVGEPGNQDEEADQAGDAAHADPDGQHHIEDWRHIETPPRRG
jgi:hypothetical protein